MTYEETLRAKSRSLAAQVWAGMNEDAIAESIENVLLSTAAPLLAKIEELDSMVEDALMLSMDGECDTCGYDSDDEGDYHVDGCEAHAIEKRLIAMRSDAQGKELLAAWRDKR